MFLSVQSPRDLEPGGCTFPKHSFGTPQSFVACGIAAERLSGFTFLMIVSDAQPYSVLLRKRVPSVMPNEHFKIETENPNITFSVLNAVILDI